MVTERDFVSPLLAALGDLAAWWQSENVPGLVIGGVAASLLGRPRLTGDVDGLVVIPDKDWPKFLSSSARFHFVPRIAKALDFAHESRMLLLVHSKSHIHVDIALGVLPFEEQAIQRAVLREVGDFRLPLPTPEDLIVMKAVAGRPRDLSDIEGILATHSKLDLPRIRRQVQQFAKITERPEMLDQLEKLLGGQRSARKKNRKR